MKKQGKLKRHIKKQANYTQRLLKREKKKYFTNLHDDNITDNKKFWKNVKPFFSNKGNSKNEITLIEGEKIISSELEVANTLNSFFENAVASLGIPQIDGHLVDPGNIRDPIEAIIKSIQIIQVFLK